MKKITYNSPVVLTFALISAGVLALHYLTNGWTTVKFFSVYQSSLLDPFFYIRLFGHVLGHGSLEHYANNMIMFLLAGPLLEEKYGSRNLLIIIIGTALVTGVVHICISNTMLLGASGIVFAFILLSSITNAKDGIPLTLIVVAIIYLGEQIYTGLTTTDNISQLTHIIGGICGTGFGLVLQRKKELL